MKKFGIYDELERSRIIIYGALVNPIILKEMAKMGFDRKEIMFGKGLLTKMTDKQYLRVSEQNTQKETTQQLNNAYDAANESYVMHVKYARLVVPKNSKAWNDLLLTGKRSKNLVGWMVQAKAFYRHVDTVADLLAKRGILAEELAQTKAMVEAVSDTRIQQFVCFGNKQAATVRRDEDRLALQQWIRKFVKAARYAFDDDKQQLESLGITVRS